jgi:hypothetical protein
MKEYTNDSRATRMGKGDGAKCTEATSSNDGGAKVNADFVDAGTFLKGGGKCDGEMQSIGNAGSIPKGDKAPGKPSLEKGSSGPKGPGVI